MKPRYLITTADECTWPTDQPVLFLGEWCRLYNRMEAWKKIDAEVVPYHWDDRKKLHVDYQYLQGVYEELLRELAEELNGLHGVDRSLRYWRILIGPWLGYFVQMLFDRWTMIERAVSQHEIAGVRVLEKSAEGVIPNDMAHFNRLYAEDLWNEAIFGQLLECWTTVPIEKVQFPNEQHFSVAPQPALTPAWRLKHKLARAASFAQQMFVWDDEAFLISDYLPVMQSFRLQWHMGQFPKLWRRIQTPQAQADWAKRQWQVGQPGGEGFSAIVRAMVPRHIPTLYLEGYASLQLFCDVLPWPKKPRLIFTSNSYSSDDVFKAWAAEKVEKGVPLVIGQHGGNYGIGLWEFMEDHPYAISDCYLSWGWSDEKRHRIKPMCNLKLIGCDMKWDPKGHALLVEQTIPRYSYRMYSVPVAGQWLDYFNDQCRFVVALPDEIQRSMLVRLYKYDCDWGQSARWKDRFPDVCLDDGVRPIAPLVKKSRLYISTYNATTFLESLYLDVPTIIFWNPSYWELRDDAIPYFNHLETVGIFHKTPESAAAKVAEVWKDVPEWWNIPAVQEARKYFCHRFSRMIDNPIQALKGVLSTLKA